MSSLSMYHWCFVGAFIFIVLPECAKAFRVRCYAIYIINPNGEIEIATRRGSDHWWVRGIKCFAGQMSNTAILQKVKCQHDDPFYSWDNPRCCCVVCIHFVCVWYLGLYSSTATNTLDRMWLLSPVRLLVYSSSHSIEPSCHFMRRPTAAAPQSRRAPPAPPAPPVQPRARPPAQPRRRSQRSARAAGAAWPPGGSGTRPPPPPPSARASSTRRWATPAPPAGAPRPCPRPSPARRRRASPPRRSPRPPPTSASSAPARPSRTACAAPTALRFRLRCVPRKHAIGVRALGAHGRCHQVNHCGGHSSLRSLLLVVTMFQVDVLGWSPLLSLTYL
jgi:hypothetical protein